MVQGDEPMTDPQMISEAVQPMLADPTLRITNLLGKNRVHRRIRRP